MVGRRRVLGYALAGTLAPLAASSVAAPAMAGTRKPPGGTLTDLGGPVKALTVVQGAYGLDPNGRLLAYAVPSGENAQLNVVDVATNTLVRTVPLPNASGGYGIVVAPDQTLYFGSYYNGTLYRYHPDTGVVDDLGRPIESDTYLFAFSVAPDGTVYGGTYPNAHAFSYHPDRGATDLGSMIPQDGTVKYVRATTYDSDRHALYIGTQPTAHIYRLDLNTRQLTEVTPAGLAGVAVIDMNYVNGKVFVNIDSKLFVLDAATGATITVTDAQTGQPAVNYSFVARGVSPVAAGGVYFTTIRSGSTYLAKYDLATDTVDGSQVLGAAMVGSTVVTEGSAQVMYSFLGNYSAGAMRYNIGTGEITRVTYPLVYVPSALSHVLTRPGDPKVYVNAFLNGQLGVYDPATGNTALPVRLGQVEGWTVSDDVIFAGTYPNGSLVRLDPDAPIVAGTNPATLLSLKIPEHQIRPMSVVVSGGEVLLGTVPDYGLRGGALTVYDIASAASTTYHSIVTDQSIAAVVAQGNLAYLGSSTEAGTGTDPIDGEAHFVTWDLAAGRVVNDVVPVSGAQSINELITLDGGVIAGLADGVLFTFNPATKRISRLVTLHSDATSAGDGALVRHPNGYLYAVTGTRLFVIDMHRRQKRELTTGVNRLTLADDGSFYVVLRPANQVNATNIARFVPDGS